MFAWQFLPGLEFELSTEVDNPEDILGGLEEDEDDLEEDDIEDTEDEETED